MIVRYTKSFTNLLLVLLFSICNISAFAFEDEPNGIISGKVNTSDNKPASSVSVILKGTKKSTLTAEDGSFTLRAPAGNYVLEVSLVGYMSTTQEVVVESNKTTNVLMLLQVSEKQLEEVVVASGGHKMYQKETEFVARMPLTNLENPQIYSVVTKDLLAEQIITDPREALKNATGAAITNYPAGGFGITSRGFSTGINARNGMETVASRSSIELGNVERIEVLKGPSGTLFGSTVSSFGGVVNLVTKKPFDTFKGDVSYTFGSYGLNRISADVNTPLNEEKTALFRINTTVNRQNSFLNYGHNNTFLIAPTLSYKVSERLTLLADAEFLNVNQSRSMYTRVNAPSGFTNPGDIPFAYNQTLYMDDANAETSSNKFFLKGTYTMSKNWTSTTLFSYVSENVKQSYQYYPTWINRDSVARNILLYGPIYNNYLNVQQNFNGSFATGFLKHKINVGVNFRYYNGSFIYVTAPTNKFIDTVNIRKAFAAVGKAKIDQFLLQFGAVTPFATPDQNTFSAYATDVVNITDRLSAMLSLRVDRYSVPTYTQTSIAPKLGLVYQLVKEQVSIFGNYMSGFQNLGPQSPNPDGSVLTPDPVYARQAEGGIKAELFNKKVNFNASYYAIVIDNTVRRTEDGFYVQDGKQVSKGIELEVNASPVAGLTILAGYTYNDNRIVRATDKTTQGNLAAGAPYNIGNVWISYRFQNAALKNLGIGVGGNYVDKAYLGTDNKYYLPSYSAVNATVFYDQPKWRLGFKANNIGATKSWDLNGAAMALTNYAGSLTIKF